MNFSAGCRLLPTYGLAVWGSLLRTRIWSAGSFSGRENVWQRRHPIDRFQLQ